MWDDRVLNYSELQSLGVFNQFFGWRLSHLKWGHGWRSILWVSEWSVHLLLLFKSVHDFLLLAHKSVKLLIVGVFPLHSLINPTKVVHLVELVLLVLILHVLLFGKTGLLFDNWSIVVLDAVDLLIVVLTLLKQLSVLTSHLISSFFLISIALKQLFYLLLLRLKLRIEVLL